MAENKNEWSLLLNVAGEQFFKPGTIDRLTDGPHEVVITETFREPSKSKNEDGSSKADSIVFVCEVAKGADKGKSIRKYMTTAELVAGSIQRKEWKNLLASVAKDPAALEKGVLTLKPTTVNGKTAYINVQNPPAGEKTKDGKTPFANVNFITKDMMAELAAKPGKAAVPSNANGAAKSFEVVGGGAPQPGAEADALE